MAALKLALKVHQVDILEQLYGLNSGKSCFTKIEPFETNCSHCTTGPPWRR